MMELKYVGAMPEISAKGVGFDQTQSDKYTLLNAAVELMEALNFGATETTQHLHHTASKEYSGSELIELLGNYCPNIQEIFTQREEKSKVLIDNLIERVHNNQLINEDERRAWLNNIDLMKDYYLQHVTNETAYECALDVLSQEIHDAKIEEIKVEMFRNLGAVLHDLLRVLEHRKSPIDGELSVDEVDGKIYGKLSLKHRI